MLKEFIVPPRGLGFKENCRAELQQTLQYWRMQPPSPPPQYSQLTSDELLKLASEAASLTPQATALLQDELNRRGLTDHDIQVHRLEEAEPQRGFLNDSSLRLFRAAVFFFGHLTVSTLGVGMTAAMLFYAFKPVLSPFLSPFALRHDLPLTIPFFPIQSVVALVVGYAVARKQGRFWSHMSAEWVWIIPTVYLAFSLVSYQSSSITTESRWCHYFWSRLPESRHDQLNITILFSMSVAYAVGNFLARRFGNARPR